MNDEFIVAYVHGRHTVRDYFERFIVEVRGPFAGCPELWRQCREHLWSAFMALDQVPRTDSFWRGTNMRTTFTKVRDFYWLRVPFDEDDRGRCWRMFTVAACDGSLNSFGRAAEPLLRFSELGVGDFVRMALNLCWASGWSTEEFAAEILLRVGRGAEAGPTLDDISQNGGVDQAQWAAKVRSLLAR